MRQAISTGRTLRSLTLSPDEHRPGETYPLVIGLHGFGAPMDDLAGLAPRLLPNAIYVFPEAPRHAFDGADPAQRAWYERGGAATPQSIADALGALDVCVQEILQRHPPGDQGAAIFGFSQGGAMALRYGLPRPDVFAGIASLSGSLRQIEDIKDTLPPERNQSLFLSHGLRDDLVPFEVTQQAVNLLQRWGYRPTHRTYPTGHWISPILVDDLRTWLRSVLKG